MARPSGLKLSMPLPDPHMMASGPFTPDMQYQPPHMFPRTMPSGQSSSSQALKTPDVSNLTLGMLTPSPRVTGKRNREDDWEREQVEVLESLLARPPRDSLHYPPGSMPPPHVLDELTSVVLDTFSTSGVHPGNDDNSSGYDASAETSPVASRATSPLATKAPLPPTQQGSQDEWPHTWNETRRMLAALALADTRLGNELADRKLTRQERLARPGVKRVGSMDYLDEEANDVSRGEPGRVLRLSTTLQNSARETASLARAASVGAPAGSRSPAAGPRPFALTITPASSPPPEPQRVAPRPAPMRRQSSSRSTLSNGSRRPSLLVRGRSFTASDLEAEAEKEEASDNAEPHTPTTTSATEQKSPPSAGRSSKRRASAPESTAPRLLRSQSAQGTSKREIRRDNSRCEVGGLLAPPPTCETPVLGAPLASGEPSSLGGAFEDAPFGSAEKRLPSGWDSDSDRDRDVIIAKQRTRPRQGLGSLKMTALAAAAASGATSPVASAPLSLAMNGLDVGLGKGCLRSPFEEKPGMDLP